MRTLPPGLGAHLASGTTTLCHCWRLTLTSGEKLGFTDHDEMLTFDGTSFAAEAGFTASSMDSSLGLGVDEFEADGALRADALSEARLNAGDFDHAAIELWRVNWQDVNQRVLLRKGFLGEVTTTDGAFKVEVRGLTHLLGQQQGRLFQHSCDAVLGDGRCGVNLSQAAFVDEAVVTAVESAAVVLSGVDFVDDWATRGTLHLTSGAYAGRKLAIKRQRKQGTLTRVDLWQALPFPVSVGAGVQLQAGCDKQFATCRAKFFNAVNFRGFPHMPGNDVVARFANSSDADNTGGRRT
jgi:uncharacterized phage protein (TIGR02218 family)